ncbi:MAG: ATP phosphoribosyltransferase regulatory subunit, partial [Clostridia bacterium]|nr:ATP phosphoribosyltransferase regulatory subunit [Clostridia bacterium]
RNKDFLVSDRIITFNDTNGKLLALKPDVTLSIIKNGDDKKGVKQKVYYNENVYRISGNTNRYKEIMQAGLECIGDIGRYDIYEVISLAAQSLAQISDSFVLEISHLDILAGVLEKSCSDKLFIRKAISYISEKNLHDLMRLCDDYGVNNDNREILSLFIQSYGERNKVIENLEKALGFDAIKEIKELSNMLDELPFSSKILFDFSVLNDMNYYNGFVFKGFIDGICDGVLAGGQYDKMMAKMGRKSAAIGFAIYLDMLEQLDKERNEYDTDVLILYDDTTKTEEIAEKVRENIDMGKTVNVQKKIPDKFRYKEKIDLKKVDEKC